MEVKVGYKQTEIGAIPQDWDLNLWGDVITSCSSGATPYRGKPDYYKGDIKWISSGELNYNIIYDTIEHISKEALQKTNLKVHPVGTFLMAITGLEAAGTRGACGIVGSPATTNQSCMAVYPSPNLLLTKYLYHYYVYRGNELALQYCQGTKQQSYTAKLIRILPIILPSTLAEQEAIAEALSDADALIEAVEQLLAKKRQVKQGAMSELLTGKRRLAGFSGEWEVKKLGDVFEITAGGDFDPKQSSDIRDERFPYPIYSNALTDKGLYGFSSYNNHQAGSITVTARGTLGNANYRDHDFTAIGRVIVLKPIQPLDCIFISEFINNRIEFVVESTGVPQLTAPQISKYEIPFPEYSEQTAIAEILNDMDAEISALEGKLVKARQVKAGMMSVLLGGKIRLNRD